MAGAGKIAGEIARAAGAAVLEEREAAEGEQDELFPSLLPALGDGKRDTQTTRVGDAIRKAGRPLGSSNATTKALREYLLARGVIPQVAMMQLILDGPMGLAKIMELDGSVEGRAKALTEWRQMASEIGRYVMAPMVPVDDQGRAVPFLTVQVGAIGAVTVAAPGADGAGHVPPWLALEPQRNQRDSDAEEPQSQSEGSQE